MCGPDSTYTVYEVEVAALLDGDFSSAYLSADNSHIVPTDTMKNTIQVLAKKHLGAEIEEFALALGDHFLGRYAQVSRVSLEISSRPWTRYTRPDGSPHAHAFLGGTGPAPFSCVEMTRSGAQGVSGIRELLVLKSTASAFVGYPKCEYTTLPETDDLPINFTPFGQENHNEIFCRPMNRMARLKRA